MRLLAIPLLVSVSCPVAFADSGSGFQPDEQHFEVFWTGSGSPPDEAQDASVYAESVSNYDGTQCDPSFPSPPYPSCADPDLEAHDGYSGGPEGQFGLTTCVGGLVDGLCTGKIVLGMNYDVITEYELVSCNQNLLRYFRDHGLLPRWQAEVAPQSRSM